jgi:hypothetical protein
VSKRDQVSVPLPAELSYTERLSCGFELCLDGAGHFPDHLNIDVLSNSDFLTHKQIGRLFLTFKKGTTIRDAEELEAAMNRHLKGLCIVHYAGGES